MKKTTHDIGPISRSYESRQAIQQIKQQAVLSISYNLTEYGTDYNFVDVRAKTIYQYDGKINVDELTFDNYDEMLSFLEEQKKISFYPYRIQEIIKDIKLLVDSQIPNKIKTITRNNKTINVGDVLYTNWGYDQTNVEMFRVVKILGKCYFILQEISQKVIDKSEGFMSHSVTKGDNDLDTLPCKGFINPDGYMSVCETGYKRSLFKDEEGKRHYVSWYA